MANISYQLGQVADANQLEAAFRGDEDRRDMIARLRESTMLYALNQPAAEFELSWLLGPQLSFDSSSRQFTGQHAGEANARMTREYRKPFELPQA